MQGNSCRRLMTSLSLLMAARLLTIDSTRKCHMKTDVITFNDLFYQNVQYQVPNFQREYVWTLEDQWEGLWEDIQDTAEEYLGHLDKDGSEAGAQQLTRRHFMGAVVIQQKLGTIAGTKKCLIIDGQQRLTTVQLLLRAALDVVTRIARDNDAANLEQLVVNQRAKDEDQLKLRPADRDRAAFRSVMAYRDTEPRDNSSQVVAAYIYFRERVESWLSERDMWNLNLKIHALETSLLGLFELVTIDLTPEDDPNIIFEVLNARGTPLSPSDLIKNHLLHAASKEESDDEVYEEYWSYFQDDWWHTEVRQGALVRTQLDIFLNYWLASVIAEEIKSHRVYPKFAEYVRVGRESDELSIQSIAQEIRRCGRIYRGWDEQEPASTLGRFFYRGSRCGLGGMSPLILWLFSRPTEVLPRDELLRIIAHIESFLVRRALCRVITAGLNRLSIALLRQIRETRGNEIGIQLISSLASGRGAARWPSDDEVEQALLDQPLYGRVGVPKIRMILAALEQKRRDDDPYTQSLSLEADKLTIEHILPRSWRENWALPDTADREIREVKRDRLVDTLGNLTLLTGKLNAYVSNGPWPDKRASLKEHPGLYLNQGLTELESWSDDAIEDRGRLLLENIMQIWPRPTTSDLAS